MQILFIMPVLKLSRRTVYIIGVFFQWGSFPYVKHVCLFFLILPLRRLYFYSNDFKQHEQSLLKQLLNAEGLSQSWIDVVVPLAQQVVDTVWPDTQNDDMDIRQ